MADRHECSNPEGCADEHALEVFNFLTQRLVENNGAAIGLHGTSSANAQIIEKVGLQDHRCIEGEFGVWFVDETVPTQAALHGKEKARDQGDNGYAVITARLKRPRPDKRGRKQWLASASDAEVLDIEYHSLDE